MDPSFDHGAPVKVRKPLWKKKRVVVPTAIIVGLMAIGSLGDDTTQADLAALAQASATVSVATTPTPTPTPTPPPSPTEAIVTPTSAAPLAVAPTTAIRTTTAPRTTAPRVATTAPTRTATTSKTTTKAAGGSVYYANCDAVRAAGKDPIYIGQPGYSTKLDRDRDGVACE